MRKLSAILLIAIFAFSQYARQLNFLECKLTNIFKSPELKCDCEKQAGLDKQEPVSPAPKAHLHLHLDEYFSAPKQNVLPDFFKPFDLIPLAFYSAKECEGSCSVPWRPPNS